MAAAAVISAALKAMSPSMTVGNSSGPIEIDRVSGKRLRARSCAVRPRPGQAERVY